MHAVLLDKLSRSFLARMGGWSSRALVVLALTYLGGVASIGGALVAGLLTQGGLMTVVTTELSGGNVGEYVFATSGIALILTAIFAPDGLTGVARRVLR